MKCSCDGSCSSCSPISQFRERYQLPQQQTQGTSKMATSSTACGTYRTIHIPAPRFGKRTPNGTFCITPSGCDPNNPMDGWMTPMVIRNLPAWVAGAPIEEAIALQLAYRGSIKALAVTAIKANATGAPLTPTGVRFGQFSTTKQKQLFPGWGARTAGDGALALALDQQEPTDIMRDVVDFGRQALIDGMNALPPPMQALDASDDNALFRFVIDHVKTVAIDIELDVFVAYNSFED